MKQRIGIIIFVLIVALLLAPYFGFRFGPAEPITATSRPPLTIPIQRIEASRSPQEPLDLQGEAATARDGSTPRSTNGRLDEIEALLRDK